MPSWGNHLILGISGTTLNDDDKRALNALKPVGVIFFAKNFLDGYPYDVWLDSFQQLISQIRQYAERDALFTTLDHEGGRVVRPPLPITRFPHPYLYQSLSEKIAAATAIELKSLGINLSWSPVADIFSYPQNPVIGTRAFGSTPQTASFHACAYAQGLRSGGILGCAKHFPGHGDTRQDSHVELPVLHLTVEELRDRELIPFQSLIAAQIPLIMTAHILFPQIDPHSPATLSPRILNHLLRTELNFQGVVVSDDLDMRAISAKFMEPGTVAQAFRAGCDLFIISRNINSSSLERTNQIAADFADSLSNGSLDESIVALAQERIDTLLNNAPQYDVCQLSEETLIKHAEIAIGCTFAFPSQSTVNY
jgi:beta-N-acetylhexosaminidase